MHAKYPTVFSPIKLGPIEVPNRFYFAPHGVQMTVGTKPSWDFAYYLAERVKGGTGLVVTAFPAHDRPRNTQATPYLKENISAMRVVADLIHESGGKIFAEVLYHWGAAGSWQPLSPPAPALGPSANQYRRITRTYTTCAMTKDDIRLMVDAYRQSTRHLREAGFDGIMVHSTHAALLEQFLSPYFNRRTDEYGGSLENRMRLLFEVLQAARDEAGNDFAVGMRLNCDELLQGGYGTAGAHEILSRVSRSGLIDYVDLDIAVEPNQYEIGMASVFLKPHLYRPYVEAVRGAAGGLPVLSVLGRITSMADGEAALAAGVCDMVGAARELIAEPEFVKNAYEGKEAQSRVCIACNWCIASRVEGSQGCTINPASYRERLWGFETLVAAGPRSKVVVIGSGPAGLEAARVSAHRGHDVTLFEARDGLGGGFAAWASLPGRDFLQHNLAWWERELHRLGVTVHLGTQATSDIVLRENPDAVIVATGALYSVGGQSAFNQNDIPGHDQDFVYRPEDILLKGIRPSGKVVVLDCEGMHPGVGVAELLGRAGAAVELVTPELSAMSMRLQESLEVNFIMQRLDEATVAISTSTYIRRIGQKQVTLFNVHTEKERTIPVDAVVLVTGRVPLNTLALELEGKVGQIFTVGDALSVRPLASATYEGQKFARHIGEPNAPRTISEAYFGPAERDHTPLPADMAQGRRQSEVDRV